MAAKRPPHRAYFLKNGDRVKSVTTVIGNNLGWGKSGLMGWSRKIAMAGGDPNVIRDAAGDFGTNVHAMIEQQERGPEFKRDKSLPEIDAEAMGRAAKCVAGYQRWKDRIGFQCLENGIELPLVSETHKYGGTIDMVGTFPKIHEALDDAGRPAAYSMDLDDRELTIVDFKTSNRMGPEMRIQLAAYAHLYEEVTGAPIRAGILHLGKTPNLADPEYPPWYPMRNLDREWAAFLVLLDLDRLQKDLDPFDQEDAG